MNTTGWTAEQFQGLRKVKMGLYAGLGILAVEGVALIGETTDTVEVPFLVHPLLLAMGLGLAASSTVRLAELRNDFPELPRTPEQM